MAWFLGIDIGSVYSKGVLAKDGDVSYSFVTLSGSNHRIAAENIRRRLLAEGALAEDCVMAAVATGTGGSNVRFATRRAGDVVCTARGASKLFPQARTVIDIGGQSTRAIRFDEQGLVVNFAASERCAAGSGQFVEAVANVLRIDLAEFGPLSLKSTTPVNFSTGCAVFGESEAVTRVAEGISKEDIAAGVNKALTGKAASLCAKVGLEEGCVVCGGGALNRGLIVAIERELGIGLLVPSEPQIVTALGAVTVAEGSQTEE